MSEPKSKKTSKKDENIIPMTDADTKTDTTVIVPVEPPKPAWPESTETKYLRCDLQPHEATAYGKEQSEIVQEIDRLENQKKASASEYKARIEEKSARARRLAGYIVSGWQEKEVKCTWHYECCGFDSTTKEPIYHPEKKTLVRDDTGQAVETRDITQEERQMALPIDHAEENEA